MTLFECAEILITGIMEIFLVSLKETIHTWIGPRKLTILQFNKKKQMDLINIE